MWIKIVSVRSLIICTLWHLHQCIIYYTALDSDAGCAVLRVCILKLRFALVRLSCEVGMPFYASSRNHHGGNLLCIFFLTDWSFTDLLGSFCWMILMLDRLMREGGGICYLRFSLFLFVNVETCPSFLKLCWLSEGSSENNKNDFSSSHPETALYRTDIRSWNTEHKNQTNSNNKITTKQK